MRQQNLQENLDAAVLKITKYLIILNFPIFFKSSITLNPSLLSGSRKRNSDHFGGISGLQDIVSTPWKGAKAMRDIISNHYFEIDAEIIFEFCQFKIKQLRNTIKKIFDSFL